MPNGYVIRPQGEEMLVEFDVGVRIRLIAVKDLATQRWKVRLPYGVTIAPHHWRRIAARACWLTAKAKEEARTAQEEANT